MRHAPSLHALLTATAMLALASCAAPVSQTPGIDRTELSREAQTQAEMAKRGREASVSTSSASMADRQKRLAPIVRRVTEAGKQFCGRFVKVKGDCVYPVEIESKGVLNAYANGQKMVVDAKMMDFLASDDELAAVVAHEYAHNLMNHVGNTQQNVMAGGLLGTVADMLAASQGIDSGGQFGKLGAQGAHMMYSKDFEREADYVGMYILYLAGYNIDNVAGMWRRMSVENPNSIYVGSTHPVNPERYLLLQKTAEEIKAKKASGQNIQPALKPKD